MITTIWTACPPPSIVSWSSHHHHCPVSPENFPDRRGPSAPRATVSVAVTLWPSSLECRRMFPILWTLSLHDGLRVDTWCIHICIGYDKYHTNVNAGLLWGFTRELRGGSPCCDSLLWSLGYQPATPGPATAKIWFRVIRLQLQWNTTNNGLLSKQILWLQTDALIYTADTLAADGAADVLLSSWNWWPMLITLQTPHHLQPVHNLFMHRYHL